MLVEAQVELGVGCRYLVEEAHGGWVRWRDIISRHCRVENLHGTAAYHAKMLGARDGQSGLGLLEGAESDGVVGHELLAS